MDTDFCSPRRDQGTKLHFDIGCSLFDIRYSNPPSLLYSVLVISSLLLEVILAYVP